VIGEDWISFPIQLLFQDENSNLVLLVDAPEILLEALGGKGWFRSVLFDGLGDGSRSGTQNSLQRGDRSYCSSGPLRRAKKDEKSLFAIA
jgi:hypothetical protein